jgi:hypothetical protein
MCCGVCAGAGSDQAGYKAILCQSLWVKCQKRGYEVGECILGTVVAGNRLGASMSWLCCAGLADVTPEWALSLAPLIVC